MDFEFRIATELGLKVQQVQQALALLAEGNTVPFITRYRKEMTGGLDEDQLRRIQELHQSLVVLEERREAILRSIGEQGLLTVELEKALRDSQRLTELEDLYLPYRPKRKTRASEARRRGLAPLAALLLLEVSAREEWAREICRTPVSEESDAVDSAAASVGGWERVLFLRSLPREAVPGACALHEEVPDGEAALAGARDILAEWMAERAELRAELRQAGARLALLRARLKDEAHAEAPKFRLYADFAELLRELPPHRVLAVNRGESLGVLQVKVDWEPVGALARVASKVLVKAAWSAEVGAALEDGLDRLLLPSLTRELREEKQQEAETHSLEVYATNLRQLLLQPPVAGQVVMGIDPGFRTGCKVAVVDATGRLLEGGTIYPHAPQLRQGEARATLLRLAQEHGVGIVAIGNGTASRETEELVASWIGETGLSVRYCVVSEAGASIYSASEEAREEFPELDATQRGNISIARRLQDPLAELVKIDPRSLGVGQYQHDVDTRRLGERLDAVVESCVNSVGVDLNTASASLLRHVAGLTRRTSRNVVEHRGQHGPFRRREQLRDVSGIGPAAYRQCAGFLRIREGEDPLDNTGIHPETYEAVRRLFQQEGLPLEQPRELASRVTASPELAERLGLGLPTLTDILAELRKPGRDPREELDPPLMRGGVLKLEDLQPGMVLEGTVRNLVDFGAFVDVGLKHEGLIHVSQLSHRRVRHPMDLLQVGQRVKAAVLEVDLARGRLALSLKALEEVPQAPRGHRPEKAGLGERRPGTRPTATPPLAPGSLAEHWNKGRKQGR